MWVAGFTWAKMWTVINFPRQRFQNYIVSGRQLIYPLCPTHVHSHPRRSVPSPLSGGGLLSPGQMSWLASDEPFVCGEVVWSPQNKSLHCTPHCTQLHINIVKFVSRTFFLGVNQFLYQSVAESELNQDVILGKNSSEILWHPCHIRKDNVTAFLLLLLHCQGTVPWSV